MPRRIPKRERAKDWADALACLKAGVPPKRADHRRADGSVPTRPDVKTDQPERDVLAECLSLLRKRGILANRLNNGSFLTNSGYHYYGIPGAGDIVAVLPSGRHLEVECKAGRGGVLKANQQKRMRDVRRSNGLYFVVHSAVELEECLNEVAGELEPGTSKRWDDPITEVQDEAP